jgi:hypothetical protein
MRLAGTPLPWKNVNTSCLDRHSSGIVSISRLSSSGG